VQQQSSNSLNQGQDRFSSGCTPVRSSLPGGTNWESAFQWLLCALAVLVPALLVGWLR
jgi:hypothetical protein